MTNTDKWVLVTGASSGIGAYVARQLHKEGWKVIATARKEEDVDTLRIEGLEAIQLDYSVAKSIAHCAKRTLEISGGELYGLFNNGGYAQPGAVEDLPVKALRAQFETNVFGYLDLTNQLLPSMIENGEGRIIIHSSVLGFSPMRWSGAYNASKFALEGLFGTMRGELRGTGVHVSLLQTGPVESQIGQNGVVHFKKWVEKQPSRHTAMYEKRMAELITPSNKGIGRFRRSPHSVHKRVVRILTAENPKPRYFITLPTYLMGFLQRSLTSRGFWGVSGAGR